jgi:hypothetical protein
MWSKVLSCTDSQYHSTHILLLWFSSVAEYDVIFKITNHVDKSNIKLQLAIT